MGIYGALNTANSGMQAQAFALEQISGNIANSRTTAFKRSEAVFQDLVSAGNQDQQLAKGVTVSSRSTNNVKGDIERSSVPTHIAVDGSGYFVVAQPTGTVDGNKTFGGGDLFTRRGDFDLDQDGNLVNGSGYYLKGYDVDSATGNVSGSEPKIIQVSNNLLPARATTRIDYGANLPQHPKTQTARTGGSELLDGRLLAAGGLGNNISGAEKTDFLNQSISGGSVSVYDAAGNQIQMQLRWAKVGDMPATATGPTTFTAALAATPAPLAAPDTFVVNTGGADTTFTFGAGAAPQFDTIAELATLVGGVAGLDASVVGDRLVVTATDTTTSFNVSGLAADKLGFSSARYIASDDPAQGDTWKLFYQENSGTTSATEVAWRNIGTYEFATDGRLISPAVGEIELTGANVDGATIPTLKIAHGANGLTAFSDPDGDTSARIDQDGYKAGEFQSISVSDEGRVRVTYTNGKSIDTYQVATASFNAQNQLKKLDGGAFEATAESGFPIYSTSTSVKGGALEASNTDISEEFSKLIVTQQAYSANSRIISTSADMLREALDMVR